MDLSRLMEAIAVVESDSGRNNYPRFEPSYAPRGERFTIQGRVLAGTGANFNMIVAERWARYGMESACSFSRWQILYHTAADLGFKRRPSYLWDDRSAGFWVVLRLRRIRESGARTLDQYARAWNGGNINASAVPSSYVEDLSRAYASLVSAERA